MDNDPDDPDYVTLEENGEDDESEDDEENGKHSANDIRQVP